MCQLKFVYIYSYSYSCINLFISVVLNIKLFTIFIKYLYENLIIDIIFLSNWNFTYLNLILINISSIIYSFN